MKYLLTILVIISSLTMFAQCENLIWEEDFTGENLDLTNWTFDLGDGCPNLCGWGNAELQWYTDSESNIYLEDGSLHIRAMYEPGAQHEYTSARIVTRGLQSFASGKVEARIKMPEGQGFWPAFWMLPEEYVYGGWPLSGEIDITEVVGGSPNTNHGTIHYGGKWPFNQYSGQSVDLPNSLADDFHTYAVEWKQDTIRWYIDNQLFNIRTPDNLGSFPWRFDQDFHILLNFAIGGYFPGYPDASTPFPSEMIVDYVRVYERPDLTIIRGEAIAFQGDDLTYQAVSTSANLIWEVEGGEVISGQGSTEVVVRFYEEGEHDLTLTVGTGDCISTVTKKVVVGDECSVLLSDFEGHYGVHWSWFQGNYSDDPVPSPNAINNSAIASRWTREGQSDDRITYTLDGIPDATSFGEGERSFAVKIFTNAPAGTVLEWRLQNEQQSGGGIFGGSYMTFQATTTVSYAWEQLYFEAVSSPNPAVDPASINQLQMRMISTDLLAYLIYIDDPEIILTDCIPASVSYSELKVGGYVFSDGLEINVRSSEADRMKVNDLRGRLIGQVSVKGGSAQLVVDRPGVYIVTLENAFGIITHKIIVP